MNTRFIEGIKARPPQMLIIHANWPLYGQTIIDDFEETLRSLSTIGIQEIIIIGSAPSYSVTIPETFIASGFNRKSPIGRMPTLSGRAGWTAYCKSPPTRLVCDLSACWTLFATGRFVRQRSSHRMAQCRSHGIMGI